MGDEEGWLMDNRILQSLLLPLTGQGRLILLQLPPFCGLIFRIFLFADEPNGCLCLPQRGCGTAVGFERQRVLGPACPFVLAQQPFAGGNGFGTSAI
jgi:hypothetical protein